jgi:pimeloyl-ACP methyl ester carboxylesterase
MKMQSKVTGSGKPVVLVPGGLTGWVSWENHAVRLSSERKVIQVQLLNVQLGLENSPLPENYSVKFESGALESAVNDLNLKSPFDMAAWSYGAMITLDYALNNPEKIRTLTLIEPPALWVLGENIDSEIREVKNKLGKFYSDISEDVLEEFLSSVGFSKPGESPRENPSWQTWLKYRNSIRNNPYVVKHTDNPDRLNNFNKPVLLVKGTGSAMFLHKIIDELARRLPNAVTTEMPAGHAPHLVSADKFLKEWKNFMGTPKN